MNLEEALLHLFRTENNAYIYDAFSNHIHQIEKSTYSRLVQEEADLQKVCSALREENTTVFSVPPHRYNLKGENIDEQFDSKLNHLLLEITEQCQLRCKYCIYSGSYEHERHHSPKSMPIATAITAIDIFLKHSHQFEKRTIGFYGGEPLLEFNNVKTCISHANSQNSSHKIKFAITTNGLLLTHEKIKFLVDHDIFLYVSLDGPQKIHDRYRKTIAGSETFNRIITNLEGIKKLNQNYYEQRVNFLCVVSDYGELSALQDFYHNFEITRDHMVVFSPIGYHNLRNEPGNPQSKYNPDAVRQLHRSYCDAIISGHTPHRELCYEYDKIFRRIHERKIQNLNTADFLPPNGACLPGVRKLYARTDGSFYPCERVGNKPEFRIGSVIDGLILERSIRLLKHFCERSDKQCAKCWALRFCSACFAYINLDFKTNIVFDPRVCENIRSDIHDALVSYASVMEKNPIAFDRYFYRRNLATMDGPKS